MDSFTQIVLGAACGEAVLGKKIGNKALLFGAIGGTIPDLDVFIGGLLYNNEIQAMVFHRGFMHSIFFSILGTFVFGWLFFKIYNTGKRKRSTSLRDWQKLFFWSLLTHPILDCFTPYGTELFNPFSNYRVAFNNIAVVDPLYTTPFFICLIVLMFYERNKPKRRFWLKLGIGLSSAYMLFTLGNKIYINSIFENSFEESEIKVKRFRAQPTIFNTILWYGVAETNDKFYLGFYSHLDKTNRITDWKIIDKKDSLLPMNDRNLETLAQFSDDYYHILSTEDNNLFYYKDLRYPLQNPADKNSSLFSFKVFQENGRWDIKNNRPEFEKNMTFIEGLKQALSPMFKRLKGI